MKSLPILPALMLLAIAPQAAGADPAPVASASAGKAVFQQRCQSCHSNDANRRSPVGPNLSGVLGRPAGSTAFAYSPALKGAGLKWTRENLDTYLASPTRAIPGVRMFASLPDKGQRAAVIEYLAAAK